MKFYLDEELWPSDMSMEIDLTIGEALLLAMFLITIVMAVVNGLGHIPAIETAIGGFGAG